MALRRPRLPASRRGKVLLLVPLGLLLLGALLAGVAYSQVEVLEPDEVALPEATIAYYDDGRTELARRGTNRTSVRLADVPEHVRNAVLAAEDRRFYSQPGISPTGILRAAWVNLRGGEISQGGSTITQQYARAQYLSSERTFTRKAKELLIAVKLDRTYEKDQVLEHYLNTIYFGRNAYGIEAAARAYFGGPVSRLSPEQGAVLAGLIRAPSVLDPREEPAAAERRFRQVLSAMRENGWYDGDPATATLPGTKGLGDRPADLLYLEQQMRRELRAHDIDPDQPGLRITTTINQKMQDAARRTAAEVLDSVPGEVRAALVSVEPGTGAVRMSYGGRVYGDAQMLDGVWQERRQPGSTFKPIALAAALEQDIGLRSRYDGADDLDVEGYPDGLSNFGDQSYGQVDLITATAKSVNTVYVPLGLDAGLGNVVSTAYDLGIPESSELEAVPSITLGTQFVRPVDMAGVFATFAAGGEQADPYLVAEVTRDGEVLLEHEPEVERALEADVAADVTHALQAVLGPGGTAAAAAIGRPAAGKTGTTTDNTAAWFVGATPQLSTAVALFGPKPADRLRIDGVREVTGGSFPARLWDAYMTSALEGLPVEAFPPPAFVGEDRGASPSPAAPAPPATSSPDASPKKKDAPRGEPSKPGKGKKGKGGG
ncbi:MAG: penicillin-binding protein [Frankiales bacterium]|nr:MAG: penicillin-binding protein [Frankiales bacterium]